MPTSFETPTTVENPWCTECLETDCIVDESTCEMIRIYLRFKKYRDPLAKEAKAIKENTGSKDVRAFAESVLFILGGESWSA